MFTNDEDIQSYQNITKEKSEVLLILLLYLKDAPSRCINDKK